MMKASLKYASHGPRTRKYSGILNIDALRLEINVLGEYYSLSSIMINIMGRRLSFKPDFTATNDAMSKWRQGHTEYCYFRS